MPTLTFQYPQSDRGRCNPGGGDGGGLNAYSFSILSRIVGAATISARPCAPRRPALSVSSVGSWALQPRRLRRPHTRTRTFSILSRIVGAATYCGGGALLGGAAFQYPQSDRGRCNGLMTWKRSLPPSLSVSSVGSWALQLPPVQPDVPSPVAFQYPQSDRGRCNPLPPPGGEGGGPPFQYPQSDRGRCNNSSPPTARRR